MREIRFAFTGGEYSPDLWGRTDLDKYDLGAAKLENFIVMYSGGVEKRHPLRFADFVPGADARLFHFRFSDVYEESFVLVMGEGRFWLHNQGAFVTNGTIAATASGSTFTAASHGLADDDLVEVGGAVYVVTVLSANTFQLATAAGVGLSTTGALTVRPLLVFTHPYATSELYEIVMAQRFEELRFTHPKHPIYALERTNGVWSWGKFTVGGCAPRAEAVTIKDSGAYIRYIRVKNGGSGYTDANVTLTMTDATGTGFEGLPVVQSGKIVAVDIIKGGRNYTAPSLVAGGGSGATFEIGLIDTKAGYAVAASAIFAGGRESGPTRPAITRTSVDFTQTEGFAEYSVEDIDGAVRYKFFRTLVQPDGATSHIGYTLGYIGSSISPRFVDRNIVPDFTDTPLSYRNPFAPGAILSVKIPTPITGIDDTVLLVMDSNSGGTGFIGYPIVESGSLVGVFIANHGEGYDPTIDVLTVREDVPPSQSPVILGVLDFETSPRTGTYPAISFEFQQRTGFAGTLNAPMTIWASRIGECRSFGVRDTLSADDPYEYELDFGEVTPIRHVVPVQQGLLTFTAAGVSLLRGRDGEAVTPLNAVNDNQSFVGAARAQPKFAEEDVIYVESRNRGVRLLTWNPVARSYENREISLFSRHLFSEEESARLREKVVRSLAFALPARRTGFIVFDNGAAASLTLDRVQEVFAFAPMWTEGEFVDVVYEDTPEAQIAHFLVRRRVNGRDVLCLEYITDHASEAPEDQFYLDAAIGTARTTPTAEVTVSALAGAITVVGSPGLFTGLVGNAIWLRGGRGVITSVNSSGAVADVTLVRPINDVPRSVFRYRIQSGEWWHAPYVTTVSGIPFEGATVRVLADGKLQSDKVVSNGTITLDEEAAVVWVGFPYTATLTTLPLTEVEGARTRLTAAEIATGLSAAFTVGGYEVNKRTDEPWAEPTRLTGRSEYVHISSGWERDNTLTIVSASPLPCTIHRVALFFDPGDYRISGRR